MKLSIIIPVLNEAPILGARLQALRAQTQAEIIVVDGGSRDDTVAIAQSAGVPVCATTGGRGQQMNVGAKATRGDILLFLHVDTQLPQTFATEIEQVLFPIPPTHAPIAGAFRLAIDAPGWSLRFIEWGTNVRSHLCQMPYGDQALFLTRHTFESLGGFANLPIMEDFEFVTRLKKNGKVAIAPSAVKTSARRWLQRGAVQTTLINQAIILGYYAGVAPDQLRKWYRQK